MGWLAFDFIARVRKGGGWRGRGCRAGRNLNFFFFIWSR